MTVNIIDTSFVYKSPYGWVQRIISTFLEMLMIIIFVSYLYHYHSYLKRLKGSSPHLSPKPADIYLSRLRKLCHALTMITLCTYCIQGLNYCFNSWSIYNTSLKCDVYQKLSVWLYHFGKFCLYIVLVLRIKVVFNDSTFHNFVSRITRIMYVFLTIFIILATIGDLWTVTATKIYTTKHVFYCLLNDMVLWGLTGFLTADLIISVLCLILFNYPLNQLNKHCDIEDIEITQLTKKYAILTTTAIISTATLILFVDMFKFGWLSLLDNIINAICLLFMSSFYSKYYDKFCGCCVSIKFARSNTTNIHNKYIQREQNLNKSIENGQRKWTESAQLTTNDDNNRKNNDILSDIADIKEIQKSISKSVSMENNETEDNTESIPSTEEKETILNVLNIENAENINISKHDKKESVEIKKKIEMMPLHQRIILEPINTDSIMMPSMELGAIHSIPRILISIDSNSPHNDMNDDEEDDDNMNTPTMSNMNTPSLAPSNNNNNTPSLAPMIGYGASTAL